jgi:hypothetical protein
LSFCHYIVLLLQRSTIVIIYCMFKSEHLIRRTENCFWNIRPAKNNMDCDRDAKTTVQRYNVMTILKNKPILHCSIILWIAWYVLDHCLSFCHYIVLLLQRSTIVIIYCMFKSEHLIRRTENCFWNIRLVPNLKHTY